MENFLQDGFASGDKPWLFCGDDWALRQTMNDQMRTSTGALATNSDGGIYRISDNPDFVEFQKTSTTATGSTTYPVSYIEALFDKSHWRRLTMFNFEHTVLEPRSLGLCFHGRLRPNRSNQGVLLMDRNQQPRNHILGSRGHIVCKQDHDPVPKLFYRCQTSTKHANMHSRQPVRNQYEAITGRCAAPQGRSPRSLDILTRACPPCGGKWKHQPHRRRRVRCEDNASLHIHQGAGVGQPGNICHGSVRDNIFPIFAGTIHAGI